MIVRLFCPKCAEAAAKIKRPFVEIAIPVPIMQLVDDGRYEVVCQDGHVSTVILDNLKYELLFEMGLNALIDGYPREGVSSFASSLERFYEFYWIVTMKHLDISTEEVEKAWKMVAMQSERQLGMYVTAYLILLKRAPVLLNPNKEIKFRNKVIHQGYIPTIEEAEAFGNKVMSLINQDLVELRSAVPEALRSAYKIMSPVPNEDIDEEDDDELVGVVNVLTAVDARYPAKEGDLRFGRVQDQYKRILRDREPRRMQLLSEDELRKRYPNVEINNI